jgi:hypothetical protein
MEPILTRCGYRCDLCLAYRPNVEQNPADRQVLNDGWFAYFGFRLPPEEICCDGCMADDPELIDKSCPVRPCVLEKGLDNCAQCEYDGCKRLAERLVVYEEVKSRMDGDIPEEDYVRFIRPYENKRRLDALRGLRRLQGANMDIDLATAPGQISWQQDCCPWNEAEGTMEHRCAVKNVSICPYFCGVEYLDTLLCCYPHENPQRS